MVKTKAKNAGRTVAKRVKSSSRQITKPATEIESSVPPRNGASKVRAESHHVQHVVAGLKGNGIDLTEKVKELLRLAQEQGYLTYNDINDALPDALVSPTELDELYSKLRNLEVEIVDQAEVDRIKQPEPDEEEDKSRLDILDDPVRMYLKQMGQIPLLTREQEVEISKRIEDAENEVKRIIYSFGFAGKEHIALAEKLISEPPKERFDRVIVDKKVEGRENHLRDLRKLLKHVRALDLEVDDVYTACQG